MLANRVKETTSTTGTGSFTTTGAVSGFRTFNTAFGTNTRFTYWAVNDTDNEWETGIGYMSDAITLVREYVQDSTNSGSKVIFTTAPSLYGIKSTLITSADTQTVISSGSGAALAASGSTIDFLPIDYA